MYIFTRNTLFAFAFLCALALPRPSLAEQQTVFISEINWAGSSLSASDEWIELYNPTDEPIDLSNWTLTGASTDPITLPEESIIESKATVVLSNYNENHENASLLHTPEFTTASLSLSNSGFAITLTNHDQEVVDMAGDGSSPFAGSSGATQESDGIYRSMVRLNETDGALPTAWTSTATTTGIKPDLVDQVTPGEHLVTEQNETVLEMMKGTIETTPDTTPEEETEEELIEETEVETINEEGAGSPDPANEQIVEPSPSTGSGTNEEESINEIETTDTETVDVDLSSDDETRRDDIDASDQEEREEEPSQEEEAEEENVDPPNPAPSPSISTAPVIENEADANTETNEVDNTNVSASNNSIYPGPYTLQLSELYPNTTGSDQEEEFISIQNTGDKLVELKGWTVHDASEKTYTLSEQKLQPNETLVLHRTDTKIALNNQGDTVSLTSPNDHLIDQITYEKTQEGARLKRVDNAWMWERATTPTQPSPVPASEPQVAPEPAPEPTIHHVEYLEEIEEKEEPIETTPVVSTEETELDETKNTSTAQSINTTTTTSSSKTLTRFYSGTITVNPETFGKQIIYMEDDIDGIQLYQHQGDFNDVTIGDVVSFKATPSTVRGEDRLKIDTSTSLYVIGRETIEPTTVMIEELTTQHIGRLIQTTGTVADRQQHKITIEDTTHELTVYLKTTPSINEELFTRGERFTITGILTSYDGELRLRPRGTQDIEQNREVISIASTDPTPTTNEPTASSQNGMILLVATSIGLLLMFARHHIGTRRRPLTI